ncbi:MAG: hypothetical protein H6715_05500 [Myxococcales bacterium]|nr:hypothetical protein [Myxococcales bacterium]MCB9709436.1 hypothetical protein [Myxococcales bacterium]
MPAPFVFEVIQTHRFIIDRALPVSASSQGHPTALIDKPWLRKSWKSNRAYLTAHSDTQASPLVDDLLQPAKAALVRVPRTVPKVATVAIPY